MAIWDDVITEHDKEVYRKAGFGGKVTLGKKPVFLIVDINYNFVGDKSEPVLKSIERFPLSCGENGWKAIHEIAALLPLVRQKQVPVIYSNNDPLATSGRAGLWTTAHIPGMARVDKTGIGHQIPTEIAPGEKDVVIYKVAPSVFHGTNILTILIPMGIDTLLVSGCTTSGCVRGSVVDAASLGYKIGVIQECTFDRAEVTHKVNLWDMNSKYANVITTTEVKDYLSKL